MNNIDTAKKACRNETSPGRKVVVNVRTAEGDQLRGRRELGECALQPPLDKDCIGVDVGDVFALGCTTSCLARLNKSPLGLVDDLDAGDSQSDPARAVAAPIIDDDYLGRAAGSPDLGRDRGET